MKLLTKKSLIFCCLFILSPLSIVFSEGGGVIKIRENIHVQKGETQDHITAILGSVQVDGTVEDSVFSLLGNITVGNKGIIKGNAMALGGKVIRKPGSKVRGKDVSLGMPFKKLEKIALLSIPAIASLGALAIGVTTVFTGVGFMALIILVLILFEPYVKNGERTLLAHPWKSLFLGMVGFCFLVPILVFLTLTIIGIPLAFLVAAVTVSAMILGVVSVGLTVGNQINKKLSWKLNPIWSGLLGFVVLLLVGLIPILGGAIEIIVLLFGLGAITQTRFSKTSKT